MVHGLRCTRLLKLNNMGSIVFFGLIVLLEILFWRGVVRDKKKGIPLDPSDSRSYREAFVITHYFLGIIAIVGLFIVLCCKYWNY